MDVDCVVIGVNCEKTLHDCLTSLLAMTYRRGKCHIFYVDGGSSDDSVTIARGFDSVAVVEIHPEYPTPGLGRNVGWRAGSSPLVHFFDSDIIVDPRWMDRAVETLLTRSEVAAVRGNLQERHPDASVYNWIGSQEWNTQPGFCDAFGGIVLMRRSVLEKTGGYDDVLVAGEDPELSQRVRNLGHQILHIDAPMATHDLAMMTVRQYWKRAFRTGYGYAAVALRHGVDRKAGMSDTLQNSFWVYECLRILIRGGGFVFLTLLSVILALTHPVYGMGPAALICFPVGLCLLFYPRLFRLAWFMADKNLPADQARRYALHCSLVVVPEFFGIKRYIAGRLTRRPLRNHRPAAGKTAPELSPQAPAADDMPSRPVPQRLAYLTSEYPGISHTFIFREIQTLEALGFEIHTASIRYPAHLEKMTDSEKQASRQTLYIKTASLWRVARTHVRLAIARPVSYLTLIKETLRFCIAGNRSVVRTGGYFIEAGVLLGWMHARGLSHVHVHFANPAATVAMLAACYKTVSYSLSVHGPDIFYQVDSSLLTEKVIRAQKVRCISYYCQSQLMRLIPHAMWDKLAIVRCGIDPERFAPSPESREKEPVPHILCVGRLVPAKGQHILLSACGELHRNEVPFSLTFVGDGPDRASLEALADRLGIGDRVTFTGAIGQDQVHDWYDRADIFALASFAEGVPVVLMEAMAQEIPVVSTGITGIPELIRHEDSGLLTLPSDADGLARELTRLIRDKNLRTRLGARGREQVLTHYDLNRNCRAMADFFRGLHAD